MSAQANLTKTANVIATREVDFVSRFSNNWQELRDLMGVSRLVKKVPGTVIKSKYAEVTLQSTVGEGEAIPYSQAQVKEKAYAPIVMGKYKKGVSAEAIADHGYDAAIQMTDDQFLFELQGTVMDKFYAYVQTGTLRAIRSTFQMALAMAQGDVRNKWKKMRKGISDIVGFCNVLDAYEYLGGASITVQSEFGMNYIENFMGYSKLFLTSEIPTGYVIATPVENLVLYYIDPSDSDFARAGLEFRVDGDTPLIGFHVDGNYNTLVSESTALMGLVLFAEYIDGIAVESIGDAANITLDKATASVAVAGTVSLTATKKPSNATVTWASDDTSVATVSSGTVTGVAAGTCNITASITEGGVTYKDICVVTVNPS